MKYISTRGQAPTLNFDDALLSGLARDGGLYVPIEWPVFSARDISNLKGLSYSETAFQIIRPFTGNMIPEHDLAKLINKSYAHFNNPDVAPLKQLGDSEWLMELFHGPTLAFKDYAMQFLGRIFDYVLTKRGERVTIIGATSGDTGSAAIESCRGRDTIEIFILHPEGRVSEVQRRQMTTVREANIHNIAIKGTFDDCQNLVKAMFNDIQFRDSCNLSAINSINWVRVMAQVVYYFYGALKLCSPEDPISFSVPTGNFGNVFAGYGAKRMGLNIEKLIIGSNRNDILYRFFNDGRMLSATVEPTISPSMDIQISSNFERLLFELYGRDGKITQTMMKSFSKNGSYEVGRKQLEEALNLFAAQRFTDDETLAIMTQILNENKEILDPHSAIGVAAGRAKRMNHETPHISLATAHPAKFPDAVKQACGEHPSLPHYLSNLYELPENFTVLDNDRTQVQDYINNHRMDGVH